MEQFETMGLDFQECLVTGHFLAHLAAREQVQTPRGIGLEFL